MSMVEEMTDFVAVWDLVQNVQLTTEDDQITWRWTSDGNYTAKSAYVAQFKGSYCSFGPTALWRAHVEGKHKFLTWLLVQEKLLTADKIQARNWQCNPSCALCNAEQETAVHLCLHCSFVMQIWELVRVWSRGSISIPSQEASVEEWWCDTLAVQPKQEWRQASTLLIYTAWNLWKERNGRIFEEKAAEPRFVLQLIKEEMLLRFWACGAPIVP
jgi:hypothetical protein